MRHGGNESNIVDVGGAAAEYTCLLPLLVLKPFVFAIMHPIPAGGH